MRKRTRLDLRHRVDVWCLTDETDSETMSKISKHHEIHIAYLFIKCFYSNLNKFSCGIKVIFSNYAAFSILNHSQKIGKQ